VKQYKTRIKRWGLDKKYVKSHEYFALLKKKRKREEEDPSKETGFSLRGKIIKQCDLLRFEKRAIRNGTMRPGDSLSDKGS